MRPDAVSPKGAIGVMQLMPATAKALDADPNDSAQNIEAGTKLLRELLIKYNNDAVKALAAYNAGEGAVDKFGGLPPYPWHIRAFKSRPARPLPALRPPELHRDTRSIRSRFGGFILMFSIHRWDPRRHMPRHGSSGSWPWST